MFRNVEKRFWSPEDLSKLKKETYAKEAQKYYEKEGGKKDREWKDFEKRAEAKFQEQLK